jgi:electron transport complex protein RnfC
MPLTFTGGVHPPESKHLTEARPLEPAARPAEVVIPLSQHIGAPAKPVVEKGAVVKAGQMVGEPTGFVSAPVHSPVSGTVKLVGDRPHGLGGNQPAVVIEPAETDEWALMEPIVDLDRTPVEKLVERIRDAGLVGMGGAAFPTHVKVVPPKGHTFDTVILNGAECEPFLTCDHQLMLAKGEEIVRGLKILLKITGAQRGFIGIEANKPDAVKHLQELTRHAAQINVAVCKVKYPQGAEKQLIKAITGREVPVGGLPFQVRVLVQNVGTAYAVWDAVANGRPLVERAVTVTGPIVKEPKNLWVKVGTPVGELLERCGGLTDDAARFILGGPMMGLAQHRFDVRRPLHPLRPLRGRVPHEAGALRGGHLLRGGQAGPGRGQRRGGLHRVRLLRLRLPGPAAPGPVHQGLEVGGPQAPRRARQRGVECGLRRSLSLYT